MEKMVNVRLSWWLEHHNIFTNSQCGFRKHRSSVDHLLALDTEVRACFREKKHLGAVFFDIEAAYDTVPRHRIYQKLFKWHSGSYGLFSTQLFIPSPFPGPRGEPPLQLFFAGEWCPSRRSVECGLVRYHD